jgi:hypothetical protein
MIEGAKGRERRAGSMDAGLKKGGHWRRVNECQMSKFKYQLNDKFPQ